MGSVDYTAWLLDLLKILLGGGLAILVEKLANARHQKRGDKLDERKTQLVEFQAIIAAQRQYREDTETRLAQMDNRIDELERGREQDGRVIVELQTKVGRQATQIANLQTENCQLQAQVSELQQENAALRGVRQSEPAPMDGANGAN